MFDELHTIVSTKVHSNPFETQTRALHSALISDRRVREILEIETPEVEDVSEIVELSKGKVLAVRMDKAYGITGFKKPVIASLILKRLIEAARRNERNKKWIDGGNVNSSLALAYFARKFAGDAAYVMSRFFPQYVLDYIREISGDSIYLIQAPNLSLGIERDFYQYLVQLVRTDPRYKRYQPLWHAKYSGQYTRFLGLELADKLSYAPDYIVTAIGAGSTLEGQAIPIKEKFDGRPKIVVPEHFRSPLLNFGGAATTIRNGRGNKGYPADWFSRPPEGIPHYVIGPHYEEMNPLISKDVLRAVDRVFLYEDDDWKEMSFYCHQHAMGIGNSSAANLVIAKRLAEEGRTVLTFIYEPFRSIYQGHNVHDHDSAIRTRVQPAEETTLGQPHR